MLELCPDVQCLGDFMDRPLKDMDALSSFALKLGQRLDTDTFSTLLFGLQ